MLHSRILTSGNRNARILVTGILECNLGPQKIVRLEDLNCDALKIESAVWMLQEKLGLRLWWGQGDMVEGYPEPSVYNFIFVMESRNGVKFEQGLNSPTRTEKWDRCIWMDSFNFALAPEAKHKHFTFMLDFDKQ